MTEQRLTEQLQLVFTSGEDDVPSTALADQILALLGVRIRSGWSCDHGCAHSLDEEPEPEWNLERGHRNPQELRHWPGEESGKLQRKTHHEQDRRDDAQPRQGHGDHPATEEKP